MKLTELYRDIEKLNEIGDSSTPPPAAYYKVDDSKGKITFDFSGDQYFVDIRLPVIHLPKIAISADFFTGGTEYDLTNKHAALKVMSFVIGSIEEWINRYKKKYSENASLEIVYLKFNPKSESDEVQYFDTLSKETAINKRDRVYRIYIEKFAKKYGSSVSFITQGGVTAKFNPPLTIE